MRHRERSTDTLYQTIYQLTTEASRDRGVVCYQETGYQLGCSFPMTVGLRAPSAKKPKGAELFTIRARQLDEEKNTSRFK